MNRYLALINDYFDCTAGAVEDHGGEVLKFIGDAVLAIFPAGDDPAAARRQALTAACDIVAALESMTDVPADVECRCAIGLAYGRVMYGNVGSRDRLDFTVIGPAVNLTARLADMHKAVGRDILVSEAVRDAAGKERPDLVSLGRYMLRGASEPMELFTLYDPPDRP